MFKLNLAILFVFLAQTVSAFDSRDLQKLLETNVCARCDLSEADLSSANLEGAILVGADLRNADLTNTILTSAIMSQAQLNGAKFVSTNLRFANLRNTDFTEGLDENAPEWAIPVTEMVKVKLDYANLKGAETNGTLNFKAVSANNTNLEGVKIGEAPDTDFRLAKLAGASFENSNLMKANFDGVDLSEVNLVGAQLRGAILCNTTIPGGQVLYSGC